MKTLITAVAALLFSMASFAQGVAVVNDDRVGTKTRTDVNAEVMAALARGERLNYGEGGPTLVLPLSTATLTRAQVNAEVFAALARGERLNYGEAGTTLVLSPSTSTLTRAEVSGEVLAALARGERLNYGEAEPNQRMSRRADAVRSQMATARSATVTQ